MEGLLVRLPAKLRKEELHLLSESQRDAELPLALEGHH